MATVHTNMSAGDVFYSRLNTDSTPIHINYWRKYGAAAPGQFNGLTSPMAGYTKTSLGAHLQAMGQAELAKEQALLAKFGITKFPTDWNDYIVTVNKLIGLGPQLKEVLNELINQKMQEEKGRAISGASSFSGYIGKALKTSIEAGINSGAIGFNMDGGVYGVRSWITAHTNEIIHKALTSTINARLTNKKYDKRRVWERAKSLLTESESYLNHIYSDLAKRYHLNKVAAEVEQQLALIGSENLKQKDYIGMLKVGEQTERNAGGIVYEYIQAALNKSIDVILNLDTGTIKIDAQAIKKNISSTDTVTLYTGDISIDTQKILADYQAAMDGTSKSNIRSNLEGLLKTLQDMDDLFVMYSSNKLYSVNKNFSGFHGTGEEPLVNAPGYINQAGGSADLTSVFKVFNSADGAMFAGDGVQEEMKLAISGAIAYLLFDDWSSIGVNTLGSSGVNSIHMFELSYIKIPLSYMLINLGKAFNAAADQINVNADSLVKVYLTIPSIQYPDNCGATTKESTLAAWETQKNTMISNAKFQYKFLMNFKSLIVNMAASGAWG